MTDNAPAAAPDDVRLLAGELATVCGVLSEIATIWRRAWQSRPDLPLGLPGRLQDAASQLAADVRELADAGPGQAQGGARSAASRLSVLRNEIASVQAVTCGPGTPPIGDAALWDEVNTALRQAASHLPAAS
jgi:hypothetical protein